MKNIGVITSVSPVKIKFQEEEYQVDRAGDSSKWEVGQEVEVFFVGSKILIEKSGDNRLTKAKNTIQETSAYLGLCITEAKEMVNLQFPELEESEKPDVVLRIATTLFINLKNRL